MSAEVAASRARHPAAGRWRTDLVRAAARLLPVLRAAGVPSPEVAATALAWRGRSGLDQVGFAARLGCSADEVADVEQGRVAVADLPEAYGAGAGFTELVDALPTAVRSSAGPER